MSITNTELNAMAAPVIIGFSNPAAPEEMAKVYIALSTEDGYEGFLYDEKYREVKANAFAYEEEEQKKLYTLLGQMTCVKDKA